MADTGNTIHLDDAFISDTQAMKLLGVSRGLYYTVIEPDPTYPPAFWLGQRAKRRSKRAVMAWVASRTTRPPQVDDAQGGSDA